MNRLSSQEILKPFAIGTQFNTRGKCPRLCTVTDILSTYNAKGELVEVRYIAEHTVMGQTVVDRNVCRTTILMGLVRGAPALTPETSAVHESLWDWQLRYAMSVENPYNRILLQEVAHNYQHCVARIEELERQVVVNPETDRIAAGWVHK